MESYPYRCAKTDDASVACHTPPARPPAGGGIQPQRLGAKRNPSRYKEGHQACSSRLRPSQIRPISHEHSSLHTGSLSLPCAILVTMSLLLDQTEHLPVSTVQLSPSQLVTPRPSVPSPRPTPNHNSSELCWHPVLKTAAKCSLSNALGGKPRRQAVLFFFLSFQRLWVYPSCSCVSMISVSRQTLIMLKLSYRTRCILRKRLVETALASLWTRGRWLAQWCAWYIVCVMRAVGQRENVSQES